jgi:hypothetical protein
MKSLFSNAVLLGLAVSTAAAVGCSSSPSTTAGQGSSTPEPSTGDTGTINGKLQLVDGTGITAVHYTLSSASGTVQSGTLNTSNSQGISFQLGQVPAGGGYTVTLSAASADGGINCLGTSGVFTVNAHATVNTTVNMVCTSGMSGNGNIFVQGVPDYCGTWQSVSSIGPGVDAGSTNGSEVYADGVTPIVITATATGANPTGLTYNWTATTVSGNGVTIQSNSVSNGGLTDTLTVTCNSDAVDAVGQATLTLVVTDSTGASDAGTVIGDAGFGSDNAACTTVYAAYTTVSTTVYCDKQLGCGAGQTNCAAAGQPLDCHNLSTDSTKCGSSCATAVTCTGGETCQNGACACPSTNPNLCGGTCTNTQTDANNCGTCGNACTGGKSCVAGTCQTVCTGSAAQCACNAFVAANALGIAGTTCDQTDVELFKKDQTGGTCLTCAVNGGAVDTPVLPNKDCDDGNFTAMAGGTVAECIGVLDCDLGISPVNSPAPASASAGPSPAGPLNPYCGTDNTTACQSETTPLGKCETQIAAAFPAGSSPATIISSIAKSTYPGGRAGAIVTALQKGGCASLCFQ